MEKHIFYLSTCSTCTRILKELQPDKSYYLQDIKKERITEKQLDSMKNMAGNYESLFSRKAMKYKSLGLKDKQLEEVDYKKFILEEYTFLKRPVFIIDGDIFIGNSKAVVDSIKKKMK